MNCFRLNVLFLNAILIFGQNPTGILNIYMDPSTKLFSGSNGVVIIELNDGSKSTICMNSANNNLDAKVACKSMGYDVGGLVSTAVPFISSKKTSLAKTYLQNLSCNGSETSLDKCPGFKYTNPVEFKCQNNNQDLNVYCSGSYTYENNTVYDGNCSSNAMVKNGLLTLKYNNQDIYFCGAKNQFTANEAKFFCKLLCFLNQTDARIINGVNITVTNNIPIGGFNSLSCPPDATSFNNCKNAYPYQRDGCTPKDNIGVECYIPQVTADPLPNIMCQNNTLSLLWNLTIHSTIQSNDVSIQYLNTSCNKAIITNNTLFLNLSISLNDCNDNAGGDLSNIIYSYQAKRTYQLVNGVKVIQDQLFEPKCLIPRNNTVVHGPFSINPTSITGGTGSADVPVTLGLYRDSAFTNQILLNSIPLGTTVFVKVMMINPPSQLVLVLVNCYVKAESGTRVNLISQRCPVQSTVQITPISDIISSFSFQSFNIPGATNLQVICETSKCGKNEIGCITKC